MFSSGSNIFGEIRTQGFGDAIYIDNSEDSVGVKGNRFRTDLGLAHSVQQLSCCVITGSPSITLGESSGCNIKWKHK